jgi:hypothetical protein
MLSLAPTSVGAATLAERTAQNEPATILTSSSGVVFSHLRMALTCDHGLQVAVDLGPALNRLVPVTSGTFNATATSGGLALRVAGSTLGSQVLGTARAIEFRGGSLGTCQGATTFGEGHRTIPTFIIHYVIHGVRGHPREGRLLKLLLRRAPHVDYVWYSCRDCTGPDKLPAKVTLKGSAITLRFTQHPVMTPQSQLVVGFRASGEVERFRVYRVDPYTVTLRYRQQFCAPPGEPIQQVEGDLSLRRLRVPCT